MTKTRSYDDENAKTRWWKCDTISRLHHRTFAFSSSYFRVFVIVVSRFRHRTFAFSSTYFRVFVIVLSPSGALAHTGILLPRENVGFRVWLWTLCLYPYPISIKQLFRCRHSKTRKYDEENAKTRNYDDENAKVRWWKREIVSHFHHRVFAFSSSYFRVFIIVVSRFRHRTFEISCFRVFVIVLSSFRHRVFAFSSSYFRDFVFSRFRLFHS